ncbi:MAG TPA: hypothetical protein VFB89_10075 [Gemmatimonadales bacterium]|nr:hypothetical protein [Gemmatimonadales bacterium]HZO31104.1 hypothetical protein [Chloroflexota bacterium]
MATESWHPKRGDHVRIRATGIEATAMKFDGHRVRVHYDQITIAPGPEEVKADFLTPVHRVPQRPPAWFDLDELEPAE